MRLVFPFDHPHPEPPMHLTELLGGKGANLAEMTSVLGLSVPPGFTITTEACRRYLHDGWPASLDGELDEQLRRLEATMGRRLGDPDDPLLVSVRSGARYSMPGMLDTVLNLGLNDRSVQALARQTGDARFAHDSYRRLIQMYGRIVLEVPGELFDERLDATRRRCGAASDAAIPDDAMVELVKEFLDLVATHTGAPFPQDPADQLRGAVEAVFRSWGSPRAITYRRREGLPDHEGTAVNVQAMVFGNRDDQSGTGVGFTRNPATGAPDPYGDFLVNAQGEDVVAGIRNTEPLSAIGERFPGVYDELLDMFATLEHHYRDMLDVEFTIEQGRLWLLQVRVGKRTGAAALRIAVALADDPAVQLTREEAVMRVKPDHIDQVLHPQMAATTARVLAVGLAASPGGAVGRAYFDPDRCADAADRGEAVILVRSETSPEDVHGMAVAEGILTSRGGLVSHAAVVARGWGKPAVCGAESLDVGPDSFTSADGVVVREGDVISIDGSTGKVYEGEVATSEGELPDEFDAVLGWADDITAGRVVVRANADTAADAARARAYGARGIGLCRTEHMFLGERLPVVRRMILADEPAEEQAALDELHAVQKVDLEALLEAMDGLPVTVRLLDPPLHEFLPPIDELAADEARGTLSDHDRELLEAARRWHEQNPMLGTRGVRLGVMKAGLYRMQVRALVDAVIARLDAGGDPRVEVMIPLVVTKPELDVARQWVEAEVGPLRERGGERAMKVGTMIETPRAAILAGEMAEAADFFSFGTNDLTQMTYGFSRDDVAPIIERYLADGLIAVDPFESIDQRGVGALVELGVERGRSVRPDLEIGVCGEHGGDPHSIEFFVAAGLDYVSCSPYRVPVARLAVAQALLAQEAG